MRPEYQKRSQPLRKRERIARSSKVVLIPEDLYGRWQTFGLLYKDAQIEDDRSMVGLGQLNGIGLAPARTDRRLTSRFPLQQEIRYRLLQSRATSGNGVGQTLDVSSGGIRFTTTERLPTGRMIEIAMHWPALLNGSCALQFVARGRVLR